MNKLVLILCLIFFANYQSFAQSEFDIEPGQSMLMTGKGPGQDGTINPYKGQDCYAVVENIGSVEFSFRIENNGKLVQTTSILKNERKKVKLLKGYELYLDSNPNKTAKAKVYYERMKPQG